MAEQRLIDANRLIENAQYTTGGEEQIVFLSDIERAPTVDALPVVRCHWEKTKDGAAWCSACKRKMNPSLYGYPRCAMCGAMMGGDE